MKLFYMKIPTTYFHGINGRDILKILLVSYLLSLSIHNDLRYNVNTHSDAYFTWNVLINHLTSRSESMVHYQSLYLTKLAFKCAHMSFKSKNTNSIWKYQSHLWKYPLSENGEMSINQVGLECIYGLRRYQTIVYIWCILASIIYRAGFDYVYWFYY